MAVNNRDEAVSQVDVKMVPEIEAPELRDVLNNDILNSIVFRKDVIDSETPAAGLVTIDYSDKDLTTVTTAVNLTISFTNLENGDVKYLEIIKQAANTITFSGSLDVTEFKKDINNNATKILYQVFQKNAIVYIRAIREQIVAATEADIDSGAEYKFPTAAAVKDYVNSALGTTATPATNWSNSGLPNTAILSPYADTMAISMQFLNTGVSSLTVGTINTTGITLIESYINVVIEVGSSYGSLPAKIHTDGTIELFSAVSVANYTVFIYTTIRALVL